ncbi:uncharacterized protein LOC119645007 [Glossina fuscipes]|uniref:Uncharacterized protein LOC119645007 n=1 Tax=Glossina fuscipes TaxID=7396 RepID=A0A9C5ZPG8_9MUSC|nr:uncharacterized protein LOC119645007 [Glossina fuscipes]
MPVNKKEKLKNEKQLENWKKSISSTGWLVYRRNSFIKIQIIIIIIIIIIKSVITIKTKYWLSNFWQKLFGLNQKVDVNASFNPKIQSYHPNSRQQYQAASKKSLLKQSIIYILV